MSRSALLVAVLVACQSPPPPPPAATPPATTAVAAPAPTNASVPDPEPELEKSNLGPECPKPEDRPSVTLSSAEADIEKQRPSFARCAKNGRGGSTEVTWIVPKHGTVEMLGPPEPDANEWCLLKAAKGVRIGTRAARTVIVNATIRLTPDGAVKLDISQAEQGNALICELTTRGGVAEGSDGAAQRLADSMTVCYRQAQRSDPSQTGGMRLDLTLRDDGTVSDVRIDAQRRSDLARDCVRATAALARFPVPSGPARIEFSLRYVTE